MKAIITGAGGFIGQELVKRLAEYKDNELTLFDVNLPENLYEGKNNIICIKGDLADPNLRAQLLKNKFDVLFHLAALPGGAAEAKPELSKKINLDATLSLIEEAAARVKKPRIIYSSTISVLPTPMPALVKDDCPLAPEITYGTHKAMVELALADLSRRGIIDSIAMRLPGIVARPFATNGLKSAFLSNVFHTLKASNRFISPVSPKATMWLMSVRQCVNNLIHAASLDTATLPKNRSITLPVVRTSMANLVAAIAAELNQNPSLVSYEPDTKLEEVFGTQSPIQTTAAEAAGFSSDESLEKLVQRALENC